MFKINYDVDIGGCNGQGWIRCNYESLELAFGVPQEADEFKVSGQWAFENKNGEIIILYDWKATNLYDARLPTISAFRARESYPFHIGAKQPLCSNDEDYRCTKCLIQSFIIWMKDSEFIRMTEEDQVGYSTYYV